MTRAPLLPLVALPFLVACDVHRMSFDGLSRRYLLHTPAAWDGQQPLPLVLALHGRLGTGRNMANSSGFDELVDAEGFAALYPWGVDRSWADGRGGSPAEQQGVDDVAFLEALLDEVATEIPVDERRVYVVGISNGGMMTQRLGCELTGRFAAAASIIASLPEAIAPGCQPEEPLSMLLMNGTEDPLVPYLGGAVNSDNEGVVLSTADTIAHWVALDGCESPPATEDLDAVDDGTAIHISRWEGCREGSGVALFEVEGGGHTWPGGPQYLREERIGRVSQELVAAEAIWAFFENRSR